MSRNKMIVAFCTITAVLTVIMRLKENDYLSKHKKINGPGKDSVLIGEGLRIIPVIVYDE